MEFSRINRPGLPILDENGRSEIARYLKRHSHSSDETRQNFHSSNSGQKFRGHGGCLEIVGGAEQVVVV